MDIINIMVGVSAFTPYMGFRLQLFFSPNTAKITYLIFYRQLLKSLNPCFFINDSM